jgi:hypothetical protein
MHPAIRRLRQEDHVFEASLDYIAKPCLKNKEKCMQARHGGTCLITPNTLEVEAGGCQV